MGIADLGGGPSRSFAVPVPRAEFLRRMAGKGRFSTTSYGDLFHVSDGFFVIRNRTSTEQWRRPMVRVRAEERGAETRVTVRALLNPLPFVIALPFSAMLWAFAHQAVYLRSAAQWAVAHPAGLVGLVLVYVLLQSRVLLARRGEEETRHAVALVQEHAAPLLKDPDQGFRDG